MGLSSRVQAVGAGERLMTDGNRVPTGNLELLSPAGRHRGTRVPTGFRVSESHIPRKHWGSAPKMARVCPLSAELRQNATPQWTKTRNWTVALLAFKIHFGDRVPDAN